MLITQYETKRKIPVHWYFGLMKNVFVSENVNKNWTCSAVSKHA